MSASRSQKRCQAAGLPYISALVRAKLFECPPSIAYDASVNGAPANPISGTRPRELVLDLPNRLEHVGERLARIERAQAIDVGFVLNRVFDRRPFAAHEIEPDTQRLERQQEVRKENRGVDVDPANRLKRDFGRQIGRSAQLEQRVAFAQRAVLAHVASGLSHEPDWRGVDWLEAAGSKKAGTGVGQWVTLRRSRARPTRSSSHNGLNLTSAPSWRSSVAMSSSRK